MRAVSTCVLMFMSLLIINLVATGEVAASPFSIILDNSGQGNPDENILFNKPGQVTVGTTSNNYTIQGVTNQSSAVIDIVSPENISLQGVGGIGQAKVSAAAPLEYFGRVEIFPHAAADLPSGLNPLAALTDIEFNIDVDEDGFLGITVNGLGPDANGPDQAVFALDKNGENKFRITALPNNVITSVELVSYNSDKEKNNLFKELLQIRISGGNTLPPTNDPGGDPDPPGPVPTPEPASLILWSAMAAGLGYRWCARRGA